MFPTCFWLRSCSFALLLFATCGHASAGYTWSNIYDASAGTLPDSQGWNFVNSGPNLASNDGGVLHVGSTAPDANQDYWTRSDKAPSFSSEPAFVAQTTLKIVSSSFGPGGYPDTWRTGFLLYFVDTQERVAALGIADTGVILSADNELHNSLSTSFIPFDTTSDYKTYQLIAGPSGISLSVNDIPVPGASLPIGTSIFNEVNPSQFGDVTVSGSAEFLLKDLRFGYVPEPASIYLCICCFAYWAVATRRNKRRK